MIWVVAKNSRLPWTIRFSVVGNRNLWDNNQLRSRMNGNTDRVGRNFGNLTFFCNQTLAAAVNVDYNHFSLMGSEK
jgi:hypothetical protein